MSSSTASVSLTYVFHAPPERVFEVLFGDVRDVQLYTMAPAKIEARAGGVYSLFDGQIVGVFSEVSVPRTVLTWRMKNWEAGVYSTATVTIEPRGATSCSVRLQQDGIPLRDGCDNPDQERQVEMGWKERVFGAISRFVGIAHDKGDDE